MRYRVLSACSLIFFLIFLNELSWAASQHKLHLVNIPSGIFGLLHVGGSNSSAFQYQISATANRTFRRLIVSEYNFRSGSTCTGAAAATATFTRAVDSTLSSGSTYSSTNDSSWDLVNGHGGAAAWRGRCTRYRYEDQDGGLLHQHDCAAWYSGNLGGQDCTSSNCGLNTTCNDSW